ncbi:hypothetical protein [Geosporobacter ferrireducens]|uniref:Uncharacterized protein n=1 Tax=Geosporobacter ferrireducens TaxID=1424294 RepID=A0A1D8GB14_9FIRM|nr:hypothetical protein [Geosporobacter ferrireducens]AOT68105.1 hypothetical protein Gferi_00035 [Geosporobacter ferrireducens]AOT73344.1 hypothetical protein Gferi_27310 [Geosporobacter ferrireducens]MTI55340.1 hypothetical protein [Geosporobacter ferrireducens]
MSKLILKTVYIIERIFFSLAIACLLSLFLLQALHLKSDPDSPANSLSQFFKEEIINLRLNKN